MKNPIIVLSKMSVFLSFTVSQSSGMESLFDSVKQYFDVSGQTQTSNTHNNDFSFPLLPIEHNSLVSPVYVPHARPQETVNQTNYLDTVETSTAGSLTLTRTKRQRENPPVPRPPHFKPLTALQTQDLIASAKGGDQGSLDLLLERIYWGATANPLNFNDVVDLNNVYNFQNKVMSSRGHIYWHLIIECDAFPKFPQMVHKIKILAEKRNLATAQYAYGALAYAGKGDFFWGNTDEAIKWWELAADQGFAPAQTWLGYCGKDDNEKRILLHQRAADRGYLIAQSRLGDFYWAGCGDAIKKNPIEAIRYWFNANQGDSSSNKKIKKFLKFRETSAKVSHWDRNVAWQNMNNLSTQLLSSFSPQSFPNGLFSNFARKYQAWLSSGVDIINALRTAEGGFALTCIEFYNFSYFARSDFEIALEKSNFFASLNPKIEGLWKKDEVCFIGEENVKIKIQLAQYILLYKGVKKDHKKLSDFCSETQNSYEDKFEKHRKMKEALARLMSSNQLTPLERQLLPERIAQENLTILAYESMMPDFKLLLSFIQSLIAGVKELNDAIIEKYIKEGADQRNAEFLELYPYLKDR